MDFKDLHFAKLIFMSYNKTVQIQENLDNQILIYQTFDGKKLYSTLEGCFCIT